MSRTVIFINSKGESVEFGQNRPFILSDIKGTDELTSDIQLQKAPFQDGSTFIDSLLSERPLTLEIGVFGQTKEQIEEHKKRLFSVFNPKFGPGTLRVIYPGGTKEILCIADGTPSFLEKNKNITFQRGLINLLCPNPYWLEPKESSEPLEAWIGLFTFPLKFPMRFGRKGESRILINNGDLETPVIIEFKGPATNPKITNKTTGDFIKVNRPLNTGDTLVINTAFGEKRVEIKNNAGATTNVFNWIDLDSTFFSLIPGENEIEYTADSGKESAAVKLTYRNRYVGI